MWYLESSEFGYVIQIVKVSLFVISFPSTQPTGFKFSVVSENMLNESILTIIELLGAGKVACLISLSSIEYRNFNVSM